MKKMKKLFLALLGTMLLTLLFSTCAFAKSSTVATIGSQKYTSLEAAVRKVKKGQTIVLKKNVTYSTTLTISSSVKNFTINLNGKTVTFKNNKSYLYIKKGSVTLTNGKIKQSAADGYAIKVKKGAALNIKKGTCTGRISNAGTMTVEKGTFSSASKKTDASSAFVTNTGKLTINGGSFSGKNTITIKNTGTLTINNGTFTCAAYADVDGYLDAIDVGDYGALLDNAQKGKATIEGGKFTSSTLCFRSSGSAVLTVTGGTFKSLNDGNTKLEGGTVSVKGGTWTSGGEIFGERGGGKITVSGGTFSCPWVLFETRKGPIKITGGTFKSTAGSDIAMLLGRDGKITVTGGTFTGRKTYLYSGDVSVGKKVKVTVKAAEKPEEQEE